jgi:translation initiation factor IF-2
MSKIRINELARQLEVPSHEIIELLPSLGVTEKKTHSSSIDEGVEKLVRRHFSGNGTAAAIAEEPKVVQVETDVPPVAELPVTEEARRAPEHVAHFSAEATMAPRSCQRAGSSGSCGRSR